MAKYKSKGWLLFALINNEVKFTKKDVDFYLNYFSYIPDEDKDEVIKRIYQLHFDRTVYDLINGEEFLEHVKCGGITDYDGSIADVFVDGFRSNLGLIHGSFADGEFLVDEHTWLKICKEHKVEVSWANK